MAKAPPYIMSIESISNPGAGTSQRFIPGPVRFFSIFFNPPGFAALRPGESGKLEDFISGVAKGLQ
jgi:hypothetical protein